MNPSRRAVKKARNKRINEMRAVLKIAIDGPWHHVGVHKEREVLDFQQKDNLTKVYKVTTCLCRMCVIRLAKEKFNAVI